MNKKRKKYSSEFKEEAVKLITEQGYKITEAARNLGVNPTVLGRWKRELESDGNDNPGIQGGTAMKAELVCGRRMVFECNTHCFLILFLINNSLVRHPLKFRKHLNIPPSCTMCHFNADTIYCGCRS